MRRTGRTAPQGFSASIRITDKNFKPPPPREDADALKSYWIEVEDAMLKFLQRTGLGFADLPFNRNAKINVNMSYYTDDPDQANVKVVNLCPR